MEHPDYYSSYELSGKDQDYYDNEYDYPSYTSNEVDYMYLDERDNLNYYEYYDRPSFSVQPKYPYLKPKRNPHKRYDSKSYIRIERNIN